MEKRADIVTSVYERAPQLNCPKDLFDDTWANLPICYAEGHVNTTVLMFYAKTIDTINLQASHLSPTFPKDVASAIQHFRIARPTMEGFAVIHEIQIEKNADEALALFVSETCNGVVLFFRHRDIPDLKIRIAYAQIGGPDLVLYPPQEITASENGIVATLSFDLNSLLQ
jgi:hypothetical protein